MYLNLHPETLVIVLSFLVSITPAELFSQRGHKWRENLLLLFGIRTAMRTFRRPRREEKLPVYFLFSSQDTKAQELWFRMRYRHWGILSLYIYNYPSMDEKFVPVLRKIFAHHWRVNIKQTLSIRRNSEALSREVNKHMKHISNFIYSEFRSFFVFSKACVAV